MFPIPTFENQFLFWSPLLGYIFFSGPHIWEPISFPVPISEIHFSFPVPNSEIHTISRIVRNVFFVLNFKLWVKRTLGFYNEMSPSRICPLQGLSPLGFVHSRVYRPVGFVIFTVCPLQGMHPSRVWVPLSFVLSRVFPLQGLSLLGLSTLLFVPPGFCPCTRSSFHEVIFQGVVFQ